jgi:hypothetical protein
MGNMRFESSVETGASTIQIRAWTSSTKKFFMLCPLKCRGTVGTAVEPGASGSLMKETSKL